MKNKLAKYTKTEQELMQAVERNATENKMTYEEAQRAILNLFPQLADETQRQCYGCETSVNLVEAFNYKYCVNCLSKD